MSTGGLPWHSHDQGNFLDFRNFPLSHGRFDSKGSKEMALKGGDEGDALFVQT